MSAFLKWLSKNGHKLSEPQKETAKKFWEARNNQMRNIETRLGLSDMAPKQSDDIEWLYKPSADKAAEQVGRSVDDMDQFFDDWRSIVRRSDAEEEMMQAIHKDVAGTRGQAPKSDAYLAKFRYRK